MTGPGVAVSGGSGVGGEEGRRWCELATSRIKLTFGQTPLSSLCIGMDVHLGLREVSATLERGCLLQHMPRDKALAAAAVCLSTHTFSLVSFQVLHAAVRLRGMSAVLAEVAAIGALWRRDIDPTHLATPRERTPKGELLLGVGKRAAVGAHLGCASRWHCDSKSTVEGRAVVVVAVGRSLRCGSAMDAGEGWRGEVEVEGELGCWSSLGGRLETLHFA